MTTIRRPLLAAALLALAVPSTATAATTHGQATLTVTRAAGAALAAQRVSIAAVRPAEAGATRIALPVTGGAVGSLKASLDLRGALRLRARSGARTRTLTLPELRVTLGSSSRVSARVGARRLTVFAVNRTRTLRLDGAAGTATLRDARVRLTAGGAALLKRRLGATGLSGVTLATVAVSATIAPASSGTPGRTGAPSAPGAPTGPAGSSPTPGGSGPATPTQPGPAPLARPATAVDIQTATITWHVRDSFIQYINAGEGTSVANGATAAPPSQEPGSDAKLVYEFHFPFTAGWYDPPSGTAYVTYSGSVNFSYRAHGIDFDTASPEIELNGASSRAIFSFSGSTGADRGVLVDLHPDQAAATSVSADGRTHTFEKVPGTIPQGAATSVFAGYYQPGEPFGWMTVAFSTG